MSALENGTVAIAPEAARRLAALSGSTGWRCWEWEKWEYVGWAGEQELVASLPKFSSSNH